jgi:hypothetical protein
VWGRGHADIERCETERQSLHARSNEDSGDPAPGPALLLWGAECIKGAHARRVEVRAENVPVLCTGMRVVLV